VTWFVVAHQLYDRFLRFSFRFFENPRSSLSKSQPSVFSIAKEDFDRIICDHSLRQAVLDDRDHLICQFV